MVHGVNMVDKQPPYYPAAEGFGAADAAWLAGAGFTVVRLGVLATGLMPSPGKISQSYLGGLAQTVSALSKEHIMVLLDLHQDGFGPTVGSDGFPAWMTLTGSAVNTHVGFPNYYVQDPATQAAFQSLWADAPGPNGVGLQSDVAQMVGALAKRFSGSPAVLGYEVLNEPWPGTTWEPCTTPPAGCPTLERQELDPLYARVDRAVRAVDPAHLIFVEPFVLFNYGTVTTGVSLPGGDPRSGLAFHQYATSTAAAGKVLANGIGWSARTGGALIATEWGATQAAPSISAQAAQFDQALVPWIFWAFNADVVHQVSEPPRGANVISSSVGALVRPYPFVVAGTPTSIAYTPSKRTLGASWSTTEPDGRRAGPGAVSSIEIPKLVYPSGTQVTVTGGRVTSQPCAPLLTVVADPQAASVSVQVAPGTGCR